MFYLFCVSEANIIITLITVNKSELANIVLSSQNNIEK